MTLPASGAISMSQVRTELGASGAISLGQASVRALAGVASGTISLSNLYGKSNDSYYLASYRVDANKTYSGDWGNTLVKDGSGNYYLAMQTTGGAPIETLVYKLSKNGTVLWIRSIATASYAQLPTGIVASLDNSFLIMWKGSMLCKISMTDGALAWQRFYSGFSMYHAHGFADGSFLIGGSRTISTSNAGPTFFYINSSGDITAARTYQPSVQTIYGTCDRLKVASNGDVFFTGRTNTTTQNITKVNSAGVLQWSFTIPYSGFTYGTAIEFDSTGNNVYVCIGAGAFAYVLKLARSNGAVQWKKQWAVQSGRYPFMDIDSADNVYCSYTNTTTNQAMCFSISSAGAYRFGTAIGKSVAPLLVTAYGVKCNGGQFTVPIFYGTGATAYANVMAMVSLKSNSAMAAASYTVDGRVVTFASLAAATISFADAAAALTAYTFTSITTPTFTNTTPATITSTAATLTQPTKVTIT